MSDTPIFEKFARLRELYPEDVKRIEADQKRVTELLKAQEYYQLPTTQDLLALCHHDVVRARKLLATDRSLDDQARAELWAVIDARHWFIERVAQNYTAELDAIDRELEAELAP